VPADWIWSAGGEVWSREISSQGTGD